MPEQDMKLLERAKEQFIKYGVPAQMMNIEDIGEHMVLVIDLTGDEDFPEDCSISVCRFTGDSAGLQLMVSVYSGLDEKMTENIASLLPYMNSRLLTGNFGLIAEDGFLYIDQTFLIDGLSENIIDSSLIINFEFLTAAAMRCRELLEPLVSGRVSIAEMKVEELRIIQS